MLMLRYNYVISLKQLEVEPCKINWSLEGVFLQDNLHSLMGE